MTTGNETPSMGVTNDMLDQQFAHRVAATKRQIEVNEAREMLPVHVNEALRLIAARFETLEARIACLEAVLG